MALLLDEPTSSMDPQDWSVEISADAAKSGPAMILVVSHDMSFVAQVADRVLFLDKENP